MIKLTKDLLKDHLCSSQVGGAVADNMLRMYDPHRQALMDHAPIDLISNNARFACPPKVLAGEDGRRIITGHGAVFQHVQRIMLFGIWEFGIHPDAFCDCLDQKTLCCFNHDVNIVLGSTRATPPTASFRTDENGLIYAASRAGRQFNETADDVQTGHVTEASVWFSDAEFDWGDDEDDPITLMKVGRLREAGPCSYGKFDTCTARVQQQIGSLGLSERRRFRQRVLNHVHVSDILHL